MGQQNLGFVERHVEKIAVGVGGLVVLIAAAMVITGAKAAYTEAQIKDMAAGLDSRVTSTAPNVAAQPLSRPDEARSYLAGPVDSPAPAGALTLLASSGGGIWSRPSARTIDVVYQPGQAYSRDLTPPAPKALDVVPALGYAVMGRSGGKPEKQEFRAVQLRLEFDARAAYEKWWPMYDYLRNRTLEEAKKAGIAVKDVSYADADADFGFRWRVVIFGVDIERQYFNHVTGWEKDEKGNDVWHRVEKPYGLAGEKEWVKNLVAAQTNDKFPPFPKRSKDANAAKAFEATRNDLVSAYSSVRSDIQWPTPPGPDGVVVYKPNGDAAIGEGRKWLAPPRQASGTTGDGESAPASKKGPKTPEKTVVDVDDIVKPKKPAKGEIPTPAKAEERTDILTFENAVKMKLQGSGDTRPLSAFIIDDSIAPGETYRFRARVLVRNPVFEWGELAQPEVENQFFLATEWTKPSVPVTIPETMRFYVLSGEKYGDGENQVNKPLIQIFRWEKGSWFATRNLRIAPGDIIRPERKEDLLKPPGFVGISPDQLKSKPDVERALSLFDTGCVLLDVREQPRLFDRQPNKAAGAFSVNNGNKTRITYLDANGVIRTQWAAYDKPDLSKWGAK